MSSRIERVSSSFVKRECISGSERRSSFSNEAHEKTILKTNAELLEKALQDRHMFDHASRVFYPMAGVLNRFEIEDRLKLCVEAILTQGIFHQILQRMVVINSILRPQSSSRAMIADHHSYWQTSFNSEGMQANQELIWIAEACLRAKAWLQAAEVLGYLPNFDLKKFELSEKILKQFCSHSEEVEDKEWKQLARQTFGLYEHIIKFKSVGKLSHDYQNPFLKLIGILEKQDKLYLMKNYLDPMLLCFCQNDALLAALMEEGHVVDTRYEGNLVWLAILIPRYLRDTIASDTRIVDHSDQITDALAFYSRHS